MLKGILNFFRNASAPSPSEPASSTFGAGANRIHAEHDRDAEWEKQVAIQKGRVKGF